MSTSSESAEQFIRLYMEGTEFVLKISGTALKNIIAALYVISKDTKQSKGKTRLSKMLKSEKELKIFSVKREDMKIFAREAKSYGVLYCALVNKKQQNIDDMVDIMVRADDAPKVNRIIERFKLDTVDKATIKSEIERENIKNEENFEQLENSQNNELQDIDDSMIDDIFSKPKEKNQVPLEIQTEKNNPLESFSMSKNNLESIKEPEKKSVRNELKEIATQMNKEKLKEVSKVQTGNLIENNKIIPKNKETR